MLENASVGTSQRAVRRETRKTNRADLLSQLATKKKTVNTQTDVAQEVDRAKKEWKSAQNLFDNVCDNSLVDYAIHQLNASEARYTYLLQAAKKNGISRQV